MESITSQHHNSFCAQTSSYKINVLKLGVCLGKSNALGEADADTGKFSCFIYASGWKTYTTENIYCHKCQNIMAG